MAKSIKYVYADIRFSIKIRDNHWWLDFYNSDKKRIRKSTDLKATDNNLVIVKKQIIPDIALALGSDVDGRKDEDPEWTLDAFADEFFELQKGKIRDHTLSKNIAHYNNKVSPIFGHHLVVSLKPLELEKWQDKLLKKYKYQTVQKYRSVLYSILDKACDNDIIIKNPLSAVSSPKLLIDEDEGEVDPFNEKEIQLMLNKAEGYLNNFIRFMLATGLRPGEIISLRWNDISFENRKVDVFKTRVRNIDGPVKTRSSKRTVDMLEEAKMALESQKELTSNYEFIFINSSSKQFYSHDIITARFKLLLEECLIPHRPLYTLRHTFASTLIAKGVDMVWVSKMLGHKNLSITLKTYTKFIPEEDDERIKNIEKMGTIMGTIKNKNALNSDK